LGIVTALLNALANLARLRWLGAAFCVLAMLCSTTHASALTEATTNDRVNATAATATTASANVREQTKTRVGGFEQNSSLNVCVNTPASAETNRGISNAQYETASAFSHAAEGAASLETAIQPYWPANNGFQGMANNLELQVGSLIDRYGLGTGTFAAPQGTPFGMRGLPLEALQSPYNIYQVMQPFNVNAGLTAPAFGQLGQGIQYQLPMSVNELVSQGYLQVIGN